MSERDEKQWLEFVERFGSAKEAAMYLEFEDACATMGGPVDADDAWINRARIAAERERELVEALRQAVKAVQAFNATRMDAARPAVASFQQQGIFSPARNARNVAAQSRYGNRVNPVMHESPLHPLRGGRAFISRAGLIAAICVSWTIAVVAGVVLAMEVFG